MRVVFLLSVIILGFMTIGFVTLGFVTPASATTVKEMRLMCADYQKNKFNVVTKPHAYCAGYFQAQIQTAEALCQTLKILYQKKPEHRAMIMGTSSLFAASATAADFRAVISSFVDWAENKDQFDQKNPSIFMNEYLPKTWPCDPSIPLDAPNDANGG